MLATAKRILIDQAIQVTSDTIAKKAKEKGATKAEIDDAVSIVRRNIEMFLDDEEVSDAIVGLILSMLDKKIDEQCVATKV